MASAFVGVDVGTGSARAGVFDAHGTLIASARRPIAIWHEPGEIVEQSSADIWDAATAVVREAVALSGLPADAIAGVGFDATCSLVVLDPEGRPLAVGPSGEAARNVIVWMDHRAIDQADRINATRDPVLAHVGGRISPEMQPPKLLWLAEHRPDTMRAAGHFMDLADFLTFRATGSRVRSLCTVTCKWTYLAHEGRWSAEFFRRIGLGLLAEDDFARIGRVMQDPGRAVGQGLSAEAAAAMGLRPGTPVGTGLIDAHAGAIGTLGGSEGGEAVDPRRRLALILGTSACCMALADEARYVASLWGPYYAALTPGTWLIEGGQSAFGAAIDHMLRRHPAFASSGAGGEGGFERLERDIVARAGSLSAAAELARHLHVLPDLIGNRSPLADPNMRGAVVGLDLRDDAASLAEWHVATVCGLAYGLAQVIAAMEGAGYAFDMLVVSGGASRSPLVRQIVADATGKMIGVPATTEPVLLGAAMLGAVAAGHTSLAGAMGTMAGLGGRHLPAGGAVAALHAAKSEAYAALQATEGRLRRLMGAQARGRERE
jgi:D-ribulokinase